MRLEQAEAPLRETFYGKGTRKDGPTGTPFGVRAALGETPVPIPNTAKLSLAAVTILLWVLALENSMMLNSIWEFYGGPDRGSRSPELRAQPLGKGDAEF